MTGRRLAAFVDALAAGRRPRRFRATPEDAAVLRTAITLREIEGLSYEDIAEIMNCPIGTVRSRIFRAREAIAEKLRPMLDISKDKRW